jgi:hypothetical protein
MLVSVLVSYSIFPEPRSRRKMEWPFALTPVPDLIADHAVREATLTNGTTEATDAMDASDTA